MRILKKWHKFLAIVIASIFLIICVFQAYKHHCISQYNQQVTMFTEKTVEELVNELTEGNQFILYSGRATCPFCRNLIRTFDRTLKSDKEFNQFIQQNSYPIYYLDSENTPTDARIQQFRDAVHMDTVPSLIIFNGDNFASVNLQHHNGTYNAIEIKKSLIKSVNDLMQATEGEKSS